MKKRMKLYKNYNRKHLKKNEKYNYINNINILN